jgi:hypothetical protein
VIDSIVAWHITQIKGVDALQTGNIESILMWIGTTLVVCVDAALPTKIVLGGKRGEWVKSQYTLPAVM